MTIREIMSDRLRDRGLHFTPNSLALERAVNSEDMRDMAGRWDEDVSAYPVGLIATVWYCVESYAEEWAKENDFPILPRGFGG